MRKFLITAAALTVGTSALAWQPAMDSAKVDADIAMSMTSKADDGWGAKSAAATTAVATATKVETTAWSEPKAETGGYPLAKDASAMGGPADTATDIWPACRPGPGDDRCIQLYEPGVTQSLAALKANAEVGMGGPFEPAQDGAKTEAAAVDHSAMGHGTGTPATAKAETPMTAETAMTEAERQAAISAKQGSATPAPAASPGVGGPLERRGGYPACSATVTDSCIQLYERGVTGRGN